MTTESALDIKPKIRVKLSTYLPELWLRQFPEGRPVWGNCEFVLDSAEDVYDWFVIYNDFPEPLMAEKLACPQRNTLLVTTEPPSIKFYGNDFTGQFGTVLTSQPEWALPHKDRIYSQSALHWFYGWGKQGMRSYEKIASLDTEDKEKLVSTVCSSKQQRHTLHNRRYKFTHELKKRLPELDIYGHGVKLMDDKAEALDEYRYHVAIENFCGEHHWTEKLADAFLGLTLPFYFGCPNAADYFPAESFIPIDIFNPEASFEIILKAIRDNEYEKRLPHIQKARQLVMEKYNIFAVLAREIEARHKEEQTGCKSDTIYSRRLLRKSRPAVAVRDFIGKSRLKLRGLMTGP